MNTFIFRLFIFASLLFVNQILASEAPPTKKYDVVIYGATSSGIAAAIQSARMKKSVVLIEPGNRIGGLTTGGLGRTDIGSKNAFGSIRMEPVFMVLGQSAAIAASIAIDRGKILQEVPYQELKKELLSSGQRLDWNNVK